MLVDDRRAPGGHGPGGVGPRHANPPLLNHRELGCLTLAVAISVALALTAAAVVLFAALWVFEQTRAGHLWPLAVVLVAVLVAAMRFVIRRS